MKISDLKVGDKLTRNRLEYTVKFIGNKKEAVIESQGKYLQVIDDHTIETFFLVKPAKKLYAYKSDYGDIQYQTRENNSLNEYHRSPEYDLKFDI